MSQPPAPQRPHRAQAARLALVALLTLPAAWPLAAEEPPPPVMPGPGETVLDGAAFDARVTGRTFYYSSGGQPYGAEQYLPGHKVVWAFTGDDCREGRWYERDGFICFTYEDAPDEQCWTFVDGPQGLAARFWGDPGALPLIALRQSPEPMACMGPDVGV